MEIRTIGIDLGKTVFHLVGVNVRGEVVVRKKCSRLQLLRFTSNLRECLIGIEACGGSHFLGRALREQGHDVRLMPAQYVKPYVKTNKNDYIDAEAIAKYALRADQPYDVTDLSPFYVIAADVNGDGKTDLVATNFVDPVEGGGGKELYLTAFYGRSDRTMERVEIPTALGCSDGFPAVADFNGDHIPDIVFQENDCSGRVLGPSSVAILPGRGNDNYGPEQIVYPNRAISPQALRANRDTKADVIFAALDSGNEEYAIVTLLNKTTGSFPTCAAPNAATGIALCSPAPGSTVSSPVDFAVGAAGDTPMRKAEVWSDGHKIVEQLAGAFSNYSFLDASVPLATGSHHIVVYAAGWDNSLESRSYTVNVTPSSCAAPSSPGVHVCSPANGSTVHSPARLEAAGTVAGTLARMEVWVDGAKKYTAPNHVDTSIPLSAGSHRFGFFAVNTNGQTWQTIVNATVQ